MGLSTVEVEGLEQLLTQVTSLQKEGGKRIFVFYVGSEVDGKSWCPDCVNAKPVLKKVTQSFQFSCDAVLITCVVGDRDTWKDPNCVFRTHTQTKLTGLPTLMEWNTPKRIGPDQCSKEDMISLVFED